LIETDALPLHQTTIWKKAVKRAIEHRRLD